MHRDQPIERAMLTAHADPSVAPHRPPATTDPACRLCGARLHGSLIDLGCLPLSNRTTTGTGDDPIYPLRASMCDVCKLVQLPDSAPPDVTAPTSFLSSRSATRVELARRYAETMRKRLGLDAQSLVIEIGSNDGYLLRHFHTAGVPVLGIEPDMHAATAATDLGIPTEVASFNTGTAMEIAVRYGRADLVVVNNVLPYVSDLFDFAAGFASILRPNGIVTLEVPHLLSLLQKLQFDAFRHDCYTYLSLQVLERVLRSVGLRIFDAERLPNHGGMLRVHACHAIARHAAKPGLKNVRLAETFAELERRDFYAGFNDQTRLVRTEIRTFLQIRRQAGRRVAAYGAATRGCTMLNACGITPAEVACVADRDPFRHGRFLPGSQIPIVPLQTVLEEPPDDLIILPWTHATEAVIALQSLRQKGTHLWTLLPRITRV